jgi:hypothetical protein
MMVSAKKRQHEGPPAASRPASPAGGRGAFEDDGPEVVLTLTDLLRDVNGEVVLFNDSGMRTVGLLTTATVLDEGVVASYVTAGGVDVSDFRYYLFEDGLKLFYPPDLDLLLIRDQRQLS